MHDAERELLSELRVRATWIKYRDMLPASYFGTPDSRRLRNILARLHRQGAREILPLTWIRKEFGKDPELGEPLPETASGEYVARTLMNARTLHWQEWVQDQLEEGGTLDLTPMRHDLLEYERQLDGSAASNGSAPLRALDVIRHKEWETRPRCPTFLHKGMDEYLGGGVGPGQLCVLQAPPKNGKSSILYLIAYRAAVRGMTAYIFSCENYEDQMGERLEQIHLAETGRRRGFPKNLYMDYRFEPCLADLERAVNQLPRLDMLIIDYADNMRATRTDGPDFVWTIDELYDGIRHLSRGKDAVAWTATQEKDPPQPWIKRSSRKQTYGSDKKIQKSDFFLGIQAHPNDNTATLTVLGRRGRGKVGADFELYFDQDTCEVSELD